MNKKKGLGCANKVQINVNSLWALLLPSATPKGENNCENKKSLFFVCMANILLTL
jgi:hypothetical protein